MLCSGCSPLHGVNPSKKKKSQPHFCNECYGVLMMSMNLSNIVIVNIHGVDYCCITNEISKSEVINWLQNASLTEKVDNFSLLCIIDG